MKLIFAVINNDDSAIVASELTRNGFVITKLSTTGGFLQVGNTTLLIGAEDDKVEQIKSIIKEKSFTRSKGVPTTASYGRGLTNNDGPVTATVNGAAVFVLNVESFEKM